MEYMDMGTLSDLIKIRGNLPEIIVGIVAY